MAEKMCVSRPIGDGGYNMDYVHKYYMYPEHLTLCNDYYIVVAQISKNEVGLNDAKANHYVELINP